MRVSTPFRMAIVFTFLMAALAVMVLGHLGVHAAAPAKAAAHHRGASASISVNPGSVIELSNGGFATTIYGQGLAPHKYYKLSDNNVSCGDTLGLFPNVQTDLNGRFAFPLVSTGIVSPCRTGSYTVKAIGSGKTYKASFTLTSARVLPTNAAALPKSVVSLSDGSFAVTIYVNGLAPNTIYDVSDDTFGCLTTYNGIGPFTFTSDAEGNAELSLVGGSSCSPGNYAEVVSSGGISVAEAIWTLMPAHA